MGFRFLLGLLLGFTFSLQVHSRTLVISDVDDTVKLAAVKFNKKFDYASDDRSGFIGMAELYTAIADQDTSTEFLFVTNAPRWLMETTHLNLLKYFNFKVDGYYPSEGLIGGDHKVETISKILKDKQPDKVLMFGDNGEVDAQTYAKIQAQFPQVKFYVFIRTVYTKSIGSGRLQSGQYNFVTPIEVAYSLSRMGLISNLNYRNIRNYILPYVQNLDFIGEFGTVTFADWQDCSELEWYASWDNEYTLKTLKSALDKICFEK